MRKRVGKCTGLAVAPLEGVHGDNNRSLHGLIHIRTVHRGPATESPRPASNGQREHEVLATADRLTNRL